MIRIADYRLFLPGLLAGIVLAGTGWAQEVETDASDATETETARTDARDVPEDEPDEEEIDVDEGSYLDAEDDDFRPSEEISADRSITFPTDI